MDVVPCGGSRWGQNPRAVTFVIYDGFDGLDLAGPFEVFGQAGYELTVVAPEAGPVRSDTGLTIHAQVSLETLDPRDRGTLVVVGGDGVDAAGFDAACSTGWPPPPTTADRVASVCCGAFILAEAGLLDGASRHDGLEGAERLAREYPAVIVDSDPIFIQDGRVWTSAGVAAGMDVALAMVEAISGRRPPWTPPRSSRRSCVGREASRSSACPCGRRPSIARCAASSSPSTSTPGRPTASTTWRRSPG